VGWIEKEIEEEEDAIDQKKKKNRDALAIEKL
jgi:hypothetical protein